ncbi:MAG: transglutaminase [Chitinivibrionales bacterium]|nr:transglutaminase [Chitinivibrionales bacterium]MBD3358481.1 transglutaminase [Chitinivibrionales bacterium]
MLICEYEDKSKYLSETEIIDYNHPAVQAFVAEYFDTEKSKQEIVRQAYEFVRDEIQHSWDIQSPRVTCTASEVLEYREGICYAKANLLAALLRSRTIPTGFCYQKLTLRDTPESEYVIHALNAVYLEDLNRWIRLDARGNNESVDAHFSLDEERLAFPIRAESGEVDYPTIYANPNAMTIAVLRLSSNCLDMYSNGLPDSL